MNFSEIWYVDASQQSKMQQKNYFSILAFLLLPFLAKKQQKLSKYEENWQNPKCLIKFSEIRYVDSFQHKKIQQENDFLILALLGFFVGQITAKIVKKN